MSYSPLTLARRHVLGDLYNRCERMITGVPVYLDDGSGERLGFVDEGANKYADAFTFHLSEDVCKKLAGGQYIYKFDYHFAGPVTAAVSAAKRRVKLLSIFLIMRKGYDKPVARSAKVEAEPVETAE